MLTRWTQHLKDPEAKAEFEKFLKGSKQILDRQTQILEEAEEALNRVERNVDTYDKPNWDYRQAHFNGYRACLHLIKRLNDLKETK